MLHHLTQDICKASWPIIGNRRFVTFLNEGGTFAEFQSLGIPNSCIIMKGSLNEYFQYWG